MTSADAEYFWSNHPGGRDWMQEYAGSASAPYRDWVLDALRTFPGAHAVFELGCHCGPLLYRLQQAGYDATGIDINAEAVRTADASGLQAFVGSVPSSLTRLADQCVDVVVSSFCLAYQDPTRLDEALWQTIRMSRLGVILVEPTAEPRSVSTELAQGLYVEWKHDYLEALARVIDTHAEGLGARIDVESRRCEQRPELNAQIVVRLFRG